MSARQFYFAGLFGDSPAEVATSTLMLLLIAIGAVLFFYGLDAAASAGGPTQFAVGILAMFGGGSLVKVGANTPY